MLSKFWVKNFRNLHEVLLELEACKSMIITGENNQGKSSLLEAIYLCNNGRSPIERDFQTIISFNSENSLLGTESIIGNQKKKVYLKINQDGTKSVTIDQKVYTTFQRKHLLRTMFMSADCLRLFHESPDKRRAEWDNFCTDFFDGKHEIFFGRDESLIDGLKIGAKSAVGSTYNIMAPLYNELIKSFLSEDLNFANELQQISKKTCSLLYATGSFRAGLKAVMRMIGIDLGNSRAPDLNISSKTINELESSLQSLGMLNFLNKV